MGLDMYLNKKSYIGAHYEHRNVKGSIEVEVDGVALNIDFKKIASVEERVGYWRKANQVHAWFVENIQQGVDDCNEYEVPYTKLLELKARCKNAIDEKNPGLMPPQKGFFFGSTEVDDGYWKDLDDTIAIIDSLEAGADYYYQASW